DIYTLSLHDALPIYDRQHLLYCLSERNGHLRNTSSMKRYQLWCVVIAAIVLLLSITCRPRSSANEKRYPLKGKVVAVDKTDRTRSEEHTSELQSRFD